MSSNGVTVMSNPDHEQHMINIVREEIFKDADGDVMIVCKDGETRKTHKSFLQWLSPFLRTIFSDSITADSIYLAEFERDTFDKVINLLKLSEDPQIDFWNKADIDLLNAFGVSTKGFYPMQYPEIETEPEDEKHDNMNAELDKNKCDDVDVNKEEWNIWTIKNILSQQCDYGLDFKTVINEFIKQ